MAAQTGNLESLISLLNAGASRAPKDRVSCSQPFFVLSLGGCVCILACGGFSHDPCLGQLFWVHCCRFAALPMIQSSVFQLCDMSCKLPTAGILLISSKLLFFGFWEQVSLVVVIPLSVHAPRMLVSAAHCSSWLCRQQSLVLSRMCWCADRGYSIPSVMLHPPFTAAMLCYLFPSCSHGLSTHFAHSPPSSKTAQPLSKHECNVTHHCVWLVHVVC